MLSFSKFFLTEMNVSSLKKMYDYINQKAFNNSLPQNTQITISTKIKKALGVAKAKALGGHLVGAPEIVISDLYAMQEDLMLGVLAHEMVHVFFYVNGNFSENHGADFIKKATEVGRLLGRNVPLSNDIKSLEVARTEKMTAALVIIHDQKHAIFLNQSAAKDLARIEQSLIGSSLKSKRYVWYGKIKEFQLLIGKSNIPNEYYPQRLDEAIMKPKFFALQPNTPLSQEVAKLKLFKSWKNS